MAFDGLMTHAVVAELNTTLADGKITKIQQPYPNEVILTLRLIERPIPYSFRRILPTPGFKLLACLTRIRRRPLILRCRYENTWMVQF